MSFKRLENNDGLYIYDGILIKFDKVILGMDINAEIDHSSIKRAVKDYKDTFVVSEKSFGGLSNKMESDESHELPNGDLSYIKDDSNAYKAEIKEEILSENERAFQILDIIYDEDRSILFGRILFLDTRIGKFAKECIDNNMSFSISKTSIDNTMDLEKDGSYMPKMWYRVTEIKNYWEIFFI